MVVIDSRIDLLIFVFLKEHFELGVLLSAENIKIHDKLLFEKDWINECNLFIYFGEFIQNERLLDYLFIIINRKSISLPDEFKLMGALHNQEVFLIVSLRILITKLVLQ